MQENKNPLLQSVFDRKLAEKDETFFLKALHELEGYQKSLKNSTHRNEIIEPDLPQLMAGLYSSAHLLKSFLSSFDVMTQDSDFTF